MTPEGPGGRPWFWRGALKGPRPDDITEVEEVNATVAATVAFDQGGLLVRGRSRDKSRDAGLAPRGP